MHFNSSCGVFLICPQFYTAGARNGKKKNSSIMWRNDSQSGEKRGLLHSLTFTDKRGQYDDIDKVSKLYALTSCVHSVCVGVSAYTHSCGYV